MLFFAIATVIGNRMGLKPIVKTNLFIMPLVIFSILIIFFASAKNFVPERLLPILGKGPNETFISGLSNVFAYSGITYLFLIMPYLKDTKQFKKISIIAIAISTIYLFLSVLCLLLVFPYISVTDEANSIYLLTRSLELGSFFQRTDALFVFLFIMCSFSYLTITLFLILDIFKKTTNIQDSKAMAYCFCVLIFGIALIPKSLYQVRAISNNIFKYLILFFIFAFSTFIMIFANLKKKKEEKNNLSS